MRKLPKTKSEVEMERRVVKATREILTPGKFSIDIRSYPVHIAISLVASVALISAAYLEKHPDTCEMIREVILRLIHGR